MVVKRFSVMKKVPHKDLTWQLCEKALWIFLFPQCHLDQQQSEDENYHRQHDQLTALIIYKMMGYTKIYNNTILLSIELQVLCYLPNNDKFSISFFALVMASGNFEIGTQTSVEKPYTYYDNMKQH